MGVNTMRNSQPSAREGILMIATTTTTATIGREGRRPRKTKKVVPALSHGNDSLITAAQRCLGSSEKHLADQQHSKHALGILTKRRGS